MSNVWILGAYQSDFARKFSRESHDFADLAAEVDAANQVSAAAGAYQVEGAKTFGTLNFGGSTATTVSFIVSGV